MAYLNFIKNFCQNHLLKNKGKITFNKWRKNDSTKLYFTKTSQTKMVLLIEWDGAEGSPDNRLTSVVVDYQNIFIVQLILD